MTSPISSNEVEEPTGSHINNFTMKIKERDVIGIFTWNVRTLNDKNNYNRRKIVDMILHYGADIIALQEVKLIGSGQKDTIKYYDKKNNVLHSTLYYSCDKTKRKYGTAFVVSHRLKDYVIIFEAISPRLCVLKIEELHISFINLYAPTNESPKNDKDEFYITLDKAYYDCPRDHVKIVMGDMNAMIGKESYYKRYTGDHSLHAETNNNGVRLINFAVSKNMIIASTYFRREGKGTWCVPGSKEGKMNQIDHILIDKEDFQRLSNVTTHRCAWKTIASDHFPVYGKLRIDGISNAKKEKREETKEQYDFLRWKFIRYFIKEDILNSLTLVDQENFSVTEMLITWCPPRVMSETYKDIEKTVKKWLHTNCQDAESPDIQNIRDRNETSVESFRSDNEEKKKLIARILEITRDENLCEFLLEILYDYLRRYDEYHSRSALVQIHMLRRILENSDEYNDATCHLFIDLETTYNRLPQSILYNAMVELEIPKKLIELTKLTINRFLKKWGASRELRKSQRKEEMLLQLLFHIVLQKIIRDADMSENTIYDSVQFLAYGGHIDVIARSMSNDVLSGQRIINRFLEAVKRTGLDINNHEMKFMQTGKERTEKERTEFIFKDEPVKLVDEYVYLGSLVNLCIPKSSKDSISNEIKRRCMLANACYYQVAEHFNDKTLDWEIKIHIYESLLIHILIYGSQTWVIYGGDEEILSSFEKRIFGIISRSISNDEDAKKFQSYLKDRETILTILNNERKLYREKIEKCDDEELKMIVLSDLNKSRKKGKPTETWKRQMMKPKD